MKQLLGFIVAIACFFSVGASDSTAIEVETMVSQYVPATECYVVFLLESSGLSMTEAKENFDRKWQEFSTRCGKEFPDIKLDVIPVNIGNKNFKPSFGDTKVSISPTIGKVIICTLSPDERAAMKLLDFGIKSGLTPFCSSSSYRNTFGAVYYGVKDPEKVLDELYPVAVKQLWNQAEKLAGILKVDQLKMSNISRNVPFGYGFDLEYRGIQIALPNEFCGIDKDKIKVFLGLRAGFEIMNPSVK